MDTLRTVAEIGFGLLFAVGAIFNAAYTFTHSGEFFGSFADGAWLDVSRTVIERFVIPNGKLIAGLLVLLEAALAVMILTRGALVGPALVAGSGFALVAAMASSPGGAVANLALAAIQISLALTR
jgi:hypothetical protein